MSLWAVTCSGMFNVLPGLIDLSVKMSMVASSCFNKPEIICFLLKMYYRLKILCSSLNLETSIYLVYLYFVDNASRNG